MCGEKQDLVISADSNPLIEEIIQVLRPFGNVTRQLLAENCVGSGQGTAENHIIIHRTGH